MQPGQTLPETLMVIIEVARTVIGRTMRQAPPATFPAITLLYGWLLRTARRFGRILATPYVPARPRARTQAPAPRAARLAVPTWRWLLRQTRAAELNVLSTQLEHFLKDPAVAELLARDPRALRLLRGMCRRIGIRRAPDLPALLFPPPRRRRQPRPKPPAPRLRDPRPIIERTEICPDTGRRTFVPWTQELAASRRHFTEALRRSRRKPYPKQKPRATA